MEKHRDSILPRTLLGPNQIDINPFTLSFPDEIEDVFRREYYKTSLSLVRISLLAGIVLYSLFGILDNVLVPEMRNSIWMVRFLLVVPSLLAVIIYSYRPGFEKLFQPLVFTAMVIAGTGINIMMAIIPSDIGHSYYAGLILVFIWGYSFTRVRFIWATSAGWLIVVLYEIIAIYISDTPHQILLTNNFFFISANVIGMCVCYAIEYYARFSFFITYLLNTERAKIKSANQRLEQIVERRTAELVNVNQLLEKEQQNVTAANRKLEDRVEKRTSQLVKANQKLKKEFEERQRLEEKRRQLEMHLQRAEKLESIGTLAGGVAHDFNNLLMGIQGSISVTRAKLEKDHAVLKNLQDAEEYIGKSAKLADQLLGFARSGKYEPNVVDLNRLLQKTVEMFSRTNKEIAVSVRFLKQLNFVEADMSQIEQVILNLLVNAGHAMSDGGNITVETEMVRLDGKILEPNDLEPGYYIKTSVTDNGVGMEKAIIDKVFDPFFTTKQRGRGTGLGLASAYGIIKNHGGFFEVVSEVGKGSTFTFYLPVTDKEPLVPHKVSDEVINGDELILLVDDEKMILDQVSQMLETIGYQVITAQGGQKAIQQYKGKENLIDLVILDLIMPGMNGEQTFNMLRVLNPRVKVLLASGYSINESAHKMLEQGAEGFLKKPFDLIKLSQKIRDILDYEKNTMVEVAYYN